MTPAEIFTQRWKLPRAVVAKLGISLDKDFGQYCRFTVTNAIGRLSNAVSVLGQTNDGAPVRPTLLLLQDVAEALEYHLHWYSVLRARAAARSPGLWAGEDTPCSTAYAASGHDLGHEDTDAYPSPTHTSGSHPWASARTLAVQHEVGAAEVDAATGGDGTRVSILHPACYTHDISCLGSTLHSHQQQQRGMGGGEGTPTALLPCVVPPSTATSNSTQEHQMRYLRSLSEQLVPRLLPRDDVASPALRLVLREVLAGSVLLPLMQSVAHPHTLNGVLRDALVSEEVDSAEVVLNEMADVATGGAASAAEGLSTPHGACSSQPSASDATGAEDATGASLAGGSAQSGEGSRSRGSTAGSAHSASEGAGGGDAGGRVEEAGAVFGHVAATGDTGGADTPDAQSGSMPAEAAAAGGRRGGGRAPLRAPPASARYVIGRMPLPVDSDFDSAEGGGEDAGWLFFGGEQTASRATSLLRGAPPCSFTLRSPPKAPPSVNQGSTHERPQAADQHEQADVIATALDGVVVTYVSLEGQLVHLPVGVHTPSTTRDPLLHGKLFIAQVVDGEENMLLSSIKGALHKNQGGGAQHGAPLLPSAHSLPQAARGADATRTGAAGTVVVIQDGNVQHNRSSWSKLTSGGGRRDRPAGASGGRPLKVAPVGGAFGSMAALLRGWLLHVARYGLLWSASDASGIPPLVCLYAEDAEGWRSGEGVHSTGGGGDDRQPAAVPSLDSSVPAAWDGSSASSSGASEAEGWSVVGPRLTGAAGAGTRVRSDTSAAVCEAHTPYGDTMHRKASSMSAASSATGRREPAAHFHSHLTGAAGRAALDSGAAAKHTPRSTVLRYGAIQKPAAAGLTVDNAAPHQSAAKGREGGSGERSLRESLQSARAKLPSPELPTGVIHSMLSSFGGASASVAASDELSRAIEGANALQVAPAVPRAALEGLVRGGFSASAAHQRAAGRFRKAWVVRASDSLAPRLCLRTPPTDLLVEGLLSPPLPPLSGSISTATRSDSKGSGLPGSTKVVIRYELRLQFAMLPTRAQLPCGGYSHWAQVQFAEALMGYMPPHSRQWTLRLRYSELLALHERLQAAAPAWRPSAPFPGKRPNLFGSNLDKDFIMARATGLRKWLQGVLSTPALSTCAEVRSALVPLSVEEAAARAAQWVDPLLAGVMGEPQNAESPQSAPDSPARGGAGDAFTPDTSSATAGTGRTSSVGGGGPVAAEPRVRFASSPALGGEAALPEEGAETPGGAPPQGSTDSSLQGAAPSPLRLAAPAAGAHEASASADFVLLPGAPAAAAEGTRPSAAQAGGGLASARARRKRRRRGTMNPLELHALELHVFGVIGALFDLRSQSWLRRNFVTVTRSVGKLLFHGTAAAAIKKWYVSSTGEDSIAAWLEVLSVKLWPQQTWFTEIAGYEAQAAAEWRAHRQWQDREGLLRALRSTMVQSKLPSLLGSGPVAEGAERLHELLNCPLFLRSLLYSVLDALLARMFPGLGTHGLRQREAVEAAYAGMGGSRRHSLLPGSSAGGAAGGASRAPGSMMLGGLGSNLQQWFGGNK